MLNLFEAIWRYSYLQHAYFAGILIACISPIFGVFVVSKRASLIPDTIGHVSFSASTFTVLLISLGLLPTTFSPVYMVMLFAVLTAFIISYINSEFPQSKEVALSFVMTFSLGSAIVMYQLSRIKTDLSAYLFGNIVALTRMDVLLIIVIFILALLFMLRYYRILLITTFDTVFAKTKGISAKKIDTLFFIILALIIASSTKFVGVLLVSALMNLPVMIVMPFTKSFNQTIIWSIIIGEITMLSGLIISYYLVLPASGVVAMILGLLFLCVLILRTIPKFKYE
ncbi:iron ABC transporter permease [Erysipelotrichaceae bacterium]|nr:iron ABC transporter permease [Erysipelotrichaceae bacterium]